MLQAYVNGLTRTYWVTTACAIAAFFAACGLEWRSVKEGNAGKKADVEKANVKGDVENGSMKGDADKAKE